ncbi:flagellar protein FlgN [Clostridium sp. P21]|uniref:Flagellar protein FlgN n=1 Tax=Clostridium muellerianum TaxID=2716538 RepID=A0A7Y0ED70_9CLOT|nr:flagellar protein FlgN [Clostridium muellerianum]NMM61267.1 flagellar protein FlgN [Clostridium muellerianum]
MNASELNSVIVEEIKALQTLLSCLDEQFQYLTKREVFALDAVRSKIEQSSREVASFEMKRRSLTNGEDMNKIVHELKDKELEKNYRDIKKLLDSVVFQKDTNDILIKQQLSFTTQMLNFLNPDRGPKTYNSYGKRR